MAKASTVPAGTVAQLWRSQLSRVEVEGAQPPAFQAAQAAPLALNPSLAFDHSAMVYTAQGYLAASLMRPAWSEKPQH